MQDRIKILSVVKTEDCAKRPRGFQPGNPYRCKLLRVGAIENSRPVVQRWIVTGSGRVMRRLPSIEKVEG